MVTELIRSQSPMFRQAHSQEAVLDPGQAASSKRSIRLRRQGVMF